MKKHLVRIVGGEYRRTPIPVADVPGLRPTPDRVRETLFNWLNHFWGGDFSRKRVLDLFAGSGALGFEAASRGVDYVQMVESSPVAVQALRRLRERLKAHTVRIHQGDALHMLQRSGAAAFDLVFLDPPFGSGWPARVWDALIPLLAPEGLVYVESESAIVLPPELTLLRNARAGHVHFSLARFDAMQKTDNNPDITPIQPQ